jgi:D-xylose transport system substrate-binding protein
MKKKILVLIILVVGFAPWVQASKEKPVIGFVLDSLALERWQRDRDTFAATVEKQGAVVLAKSGDGDDARQDAVVQDLVRRKVDVIVIVPVNGAGLRAGLKAANDAQIPVISYDRLILNADVAYYLSFDNAKVGELQAGYIAARLPADRPAKIVRIHGPQSDHNVALFKKGQDQVLDPLIKSGRIEVLQEVWSTSWQPDAAQVVIEAAMARFGPNFDAVLADNDSIAGAVIEEVSKKQPIGSLIVTGQDADLPACLRIKNGTQAMTVYKPLNKLAVLAAQVALQVAKGEKPATTATIDNGFKAVPFIYESVIAVDKDNLASTVIADGFHRRK